MPAIPKRRRIKGRRSSLAGRPRRGGHANQKTSGARTGHEDLCPRLLRGSEVPIRLLISYMARDVATPANLYPAGLISISLLCALLVVS
jgi:hypothetical protein